MTRRDVAEVTIKLAGGYFIAEAILTLVRSMVDLLYIQRNPWKSPFAMFIGILLPCALQAGVGRWLMRANVHLANRFFPEKTEDISNTPPPSPLAGSEIQAIALSVLGVYFCVFAFAGLAELVYQCIRVRIYYVNVPVKPPEVTRALIGPLIRYVTELGVGLWLFTGGEQLSSIWSRFRHGPIYPGEVEPPAGDAS